MSYISNSPICINVHGCEETIGNTICLYRNGAINILVTLLDFNDDLFLYKVLKVNKSIRYMKLYLLFTYEERFFYILIYHSDIAIGYICFDIHKLFHKHVKINERIETDMLIKEFQIKASSKSFVLFVEHYKKIIFTVGNNIYISSPISISPTLTDNSQPTFEKLIVTSEIGNINRKQYLNGNTQ